jgi:hypothetical protein
MPDISANVIPLVIEFAAGTRLLREPDLPQGLPILQNGPPGTFVIFADGFRVSLPTDQIVFADDSGDGVRVGFGGMCFTGVEGEQLIFQRVREIHPEAQLSPERSRIMVLSLGWVASISIDAIRTDSSWTSHRPVSR